MSLFSYDPDNYGIPTRKRPSRWAEAEIDRWLETLESLLSDVADDPEVAEPLARLIDQTRSRQQESADRARRALDSLDSWLLESEQPDSGDPA